MDKNKDYMYGNHMHYDNGEVEGGVGDTVVALIMAILAVIVLPFVIVYEIVTK